MGVTDKAGSLISVIMAMRNNALTIGQTIASLINQSEKNWELVLIDDGSSDDGVERVMAFADERIRIFRGGTSLGLAARLNEAVSYARGAFIARIDADDICYPARLELQLAYLQAHPELDVIACGAIVFSGDGNALGLLPVGRDHREITLSPMGGFPFPHPTWFGKAEWFRRHPYDPALRKAQDQDLILRTYADSRFGAVPDVLLGYRQEAIALAKVFRGRLTFIKSMIRHSRKTNLSTRSLTRAIAAQAIKATLDSMAVGLGFGTTLQKKKLWHADAATVAAWRSVWREVNA